MNASKHQCRDSSTNAGQQGKPFQKNRSVKVNRNKHKIDDRDMHTYRPCFGHTGDMS